MDGVQRWEPFRMPHFSALPERRHVQAAPVRPCVPSPLSTDALRAAPDARGSEAPDDQTIG